MKIKNVTDNAIIFDNGNSITFSHEQECCEWNYADFSILDERNVNYDFDENLIFEFVDEAGFMFGSEDVLHYMHRIFIPCYSEQNGYYTTDIDIYYNDKKVLSGECELHL